jgi:AcrR family transcriptional regulator
MPHQKKRHLQLERLYRYFAEFGFKQVDNISYLTKAIGISRSLFYFYFADTDDLLKQLSDYHNEKISEQRSIVVSHSFNHTQYLQGLVTHKDLYFFTIQCRRHRHEHPHIDLMYQYVIETIDQVNFRLFVEHYNLESFSESAIKTLYDVFRGFWYDNSDYETWNQERVLELSQQIQEMMLLLRSRHEPSGDQTEAESV